jgi:hypothetical protein
MSPNSGCIDGHSWNASCIALPGGFQRSTYDKGWPRLALAPLLRSFGGKPPIRRLILEADLKGIQIDF